MPVWDSVLGASEDKGCNATWARLNALVATGWKKACYYLRHWLPQRDHSSASTGWWRQFLPGHEGSVKCLLLCVVDQK
eukprot:scaffold66_cov115-Cylindrotheca_fusiformis.AAC.6